MEGGQVGWMEDRGIVIDAVVLFGWRSRLMALGRRPLEPRASLLLLRFHLTTAKAHRFTPFTSARFCACVP
jgi:hypothetical protein